MGKPIWLSWVLIGGYIVFCIWWQVHFILPFVLVGRYWDAFDMIMGLNPAFPFIMMVIYGILYSIGTVLIWFRNIWVKLFGE